MKERDFFKYISKLNSGEISWIVGLILYIIIGIMNVNLDLFDSGNEYICLVVGGFMIIGVSIRYYEKHLKIRREKLESPFATGDTAIASIMMNHSFSFAKYFKVLRIHFLVPQILGIVILVANGIACRQKISLLFALLLAVVPAIISIIYQMIVQHNGENKSVIICTKALLYIASSVGIVLSLIMSIITCVSGLLLVQQLILPVTIDENVPTRIISGGDRLAFVYTISAVFLMGVLLVDSCRKALSLRKRTFFLIRLSLFLIMLITGISNIMITTGSFTMMRGDSIVVSEKSQIKEYTLDDVKKCYIYEKDGNIDAKLEFDDGTERGIMQGDSQNNTKWDEMYHSDFNYGADLVQKLRERGVECQVSDADRLGKDAESISKQSKEGWDRIKRLI